METQSMLKEADKGNDKQRDYSRDNQNRETNWNLAHLTLSDVALRFFDGDPNLRDLMPLVDQLCATNNLDDKNIQMYRCMISSKIAEKMAWSDEDDETGFGNLDTARQYMFQILDGCRDGYRGKLATILKREYNVREPPPQRKKFLGLF